MRALVTVAVAVTLLTSAPAFAAAETAQEFVKKIYAPYADPKNKLPPSRDEVYSKDMIKLMERDAELAKGEVGYLNGDPLCDCQDYASFKPDVTVVQKLRKGMAKVAFKIFDRHTSLTLKLVEEGGHWRVDDVISEEGSLQAALKKSNETAAKR